MFLTDGLCLCSTLLSHSLTVLTFSVPCLCLGQFLCPSSAKVSRSFIVSCFLCNVFIHNWVFAQFWGGNKRNVSLSNNSLFSLQGQLCTFARVLSLLGRYFHYFEERKLPYLLFYVDMHILIDKALKHFYMLQESLILCKHGNILLSLTLKENTISKIFTTFCIYILYKYLPKRESTHEHVQSCLSNEKREYATGVFL